MQSKNFEDRFKRYQNNVYLNGELCGSSYVSERYRGEAYTMSELIVRFSGRRVGRMLEKPWAMIPPRQNSDGTRKNHRRDKENYAGATERWNALCKAINKQATDSGRCDDGQMSVGGEYLASLAKLPMPNGMEALEKRNGLRFGIIDVVVISGRGQKDNPSHPCLLEPTTIRLKADEMEVKSSLEPNPKTSVSKPRQSNDANAQIIAQAFPVDSYELSTKNSRVSIPQVSFAGDVVSEAESKTAQFSGTEPFAVTRYTQGQRELGKSDVIRESSPTSLEDTRRNRSASAPISQSQTSIEPHHDTEYLNKIILSQEHQDTNVVAGPQRRSALANELAALVQENGRAFLDADGVVLPARLRKPASKPQSSTESLDRSAIQRRTSFSAQPRYYATSPASEFSSQPRSSQMMRTHSQNDMGLLSGRRSSNSPESHLGNAPRKRYKGPSSSPPPKGPQPKRARFSYQMVLDDKRTLAEEIAAIAEQALKELEMAAAAGSNKPARATRSTFTSSATSSIVASPIAAGQTAATLSGDPKATMTPVINSDDLRQDFSPSKIKLKLKLKTPASPDATKASPVSSSPACKMPLPIHLIRPKRDPTRSAPQASTSAPTTTHETLQDPNSAPNHIPCNTPSDQDISALKTRAIPVDAPAPYPSGHLRNPRTSIAPSIETLDANYEIPELSKDCAIGYAAPGVLRQVRGERGGWFVEESVVMGVRFVVG